MQQPPQRREPAIMPAIRPQRTANPQLSGICPLMEPHRWRSACVRLGGGQPTARSSACRKDVRRPPPPMPTRCERNSAATDHRQPIPDPGELCAATARPVRPPAGPDRPGGSARTHSLQRRQHDRSAACASINLPVRPRAHPIAGQPASWRLVPDRDGACSATASWCSRTPARCFPMAGVSRRTGRPT